MSLILSGDSGITFPNSSTQAVGFYGFKNRIINGAMVIDQRDAGASVTPVNQQYTLDRWLSIVGAASKFSIQQNAGSVTPPAGFTNYLGATSLSAYSVAAGDVFGQETRIEGYNTADLAWGTANAKSITISFWVYSSLTGSFGGVVRNNANTRSYPFLFTVSSANTWTLISVTVPGDTSGTWLTNNLSGVKVTFNLGTGSTYSGTAGAWASAEYYSATGATSVVGTSGATFYITGVQLEAGSTATSFDYRPYGTELVLCQRYYQAINFSEAQNTYTKWGTGVAYSTTNARINVPLLVKMRTYPSLNVTSTASNYGVYYLADIACNTVPTINPNSNPSVATIEASVAAGLTGGGAVLGQANNNQTAYLGFSAEL